MNAEKKRLNEAKWKKWGPYLSERQWGTVREDYSEYGHPWDYFPHDHARSRVYRWGEDGIAGISDDLQRMCFAVALWNGKDPILKERLFGLTGSEGNHGEDVKELYYYLDSTPSHSYMKHLYKYPQAEYPYEDLVNTCRNRSRFENEYELLDTGLFDKGEYFDVFTEYAKSDAEDILIKITIHNRSEDPAYIAVLPTLWFRNLWSFGLVKERPRMYLQKAINGFGEVAVIDYSSEEYHFYFDEPARTLFTENETNTQRLYGQPNKTPFVKDAFHTAVTQNSYGWIEARKEGTKFAPLYEFNVEGRSSVMIKLRLSRKAIDQYPFGNFDAVFNAR